jgi:hypothetical protein
VTGGFSRRIQLHGVTIIFFIVIFYSTFKEFKYLYEHVHASTFTSRYCSGQACLFSTWMSEVFNNVFSREYYKIKTPASSCSYLLDITCLLAHFFIS